MKRIVVLILSLELLIVLLLWIGWRVSLSRRAPPSPGAPPDALTPAADRGALVAAGEQLVRGRGGCLVCHRIGETGGTIGPDLRGVGERAATRRPGTSAEAYLRESLLAPQAFLVEGFSEVMPAADGPPSRLSATEIKAVTAFLQSLGGRVTVRVTEEDVMASAGHAPFPAGRGSTRPAPSAVELLHRKGCTGCHDIDGEVRRIGPPLTRVGRRLSRDEIVAGILDPDAVIPEGYPAGAMPRTYARELGRDELDAIVDYLMGLGGSP